jgi:outer membrane cobalamin receptor
VKATTALVALASGALSASSVSADEVDIEVPILVIDDLGDAAGPSEDDDLTQLVLSASKRVQTVQESSSIVTVVTRPQMILRGHRNLSDVLDEVPGFDGYRPNFYFDTPDAFARGNARTILVLWNGVPLNSPQTNQRALGPYLPISAMSRVEAVSGPGGVLWGANALLGIVSITGMRAEQLAWGAEVSGTLGSGAAAEGLYRGSASFAHSFADGDVRLYADLSLYSSVGPVLDPDYDLQITPFPAPDTDATVSLVPSTGSTHNQRDLWVPLTLAVDVGDFSIDVLYPIVAREFREFNDSGSRTDQIQVAGMGPILPSPSSRRAENLVLASVQFDRALSDRSRLLARAFWTGFEDRWVKLVKYAPGLLSPDAIVVDERYTGMNPYLHDGAYRTGVSTDYSRNGERSQLIVGGEAYVEGIREVRQELSGGLALADSWVLTNPGQRVVTSLYADERIDLHRRFAIDVGGRGQYAPGAYAPLLLGSLAMRWNVFGGWNLKTNVAQGFRPPALALINGNDETNPYAHRQSNPDLKAERSLSLEGEVSGMLLRDAPRIRYVALRFGYQHTRLDDMVVFDGGGRPVNANRRDLGSIEVRSDVAFLAGHRFVLGYSFLQGVDRQTGPLRHLPEHRLVLGLEARVSRHLQLYTGTSYVGPSEDLNRLPLAGSGMGSIAPPASVVVDRLPPSALVDVGLLAPGLVDGHLDVALHIDNLFDHRRYIADPDFDRRQAILPMRTAGFSAQLSLTWRM